MMKSYKILFLCLFCAVSRNVPADYRTFTYHDVEYGVFEADPKEVSFHWRDEQGKDFRSLANLKNKLQRNGRIKMLMNAGIYTKNHEPAGLWIERGKTLKALNNERGSGNFYLRPNGIFAISQGKARILATPDYLKAGLKPAWALQSGPMLIIDGKPNRRFRPTLDSPHKRNAVCVTKNGKLYFFMTLSGEPNLYYLSRALLQRGCYNALYLDGSISDWYIPGKFNTFHWSDFVGMIAVSAEK